jgi:hypothetical protein
MIATPLRYPPVADLARPMLRLAGLRIDPATNGIHHAPARTSLAFERIADGRVALPAGARITAVAIAPDESRFAMTNATAHGTELWIRTVGDGRAARVANLAVNDVFPEAIRWMPDGAHLLVRAVDCHGAPPAESVAGGPAVQETSGKAGQIVTYEDMLTNAHDEALFEYYATSRIALVDARTGAVARTGARGIFTALSPSPNGRYLLAERVHRPFSYLFPYERFPRATEVLDTSGKQVETIADRPLQDRIPADGVPTGPREVAWKPSSPESFAFLQALDDGDPRTKAAARRDVVVETVRSSPTIVQRPEHLARTAARTLSYEWLDGDDRALINTYDRDTRTRTVLLTDARAAAGSADGGKTIFTLRDNDVYDDPGIPISSFAANGELFVAHVEQLRRRPLVRRVHDGEPAGAHAPVQGRDAEMLDWLNRWLGPARVTQKAS